MYMTELARIAPMLSAGSRCSTSHSIPILCVILWSLILFHNVRDLSLILILVYCPISVGIMCRDSR